MDTKFSVALHILAMISESQKTLSSQALAESVGTNASYIRKVIGLLKGAGLIASHQGKVGYQLTKAISEISLLEVYYATQEVSQIKLFQVHQSPNEDCPVGRHIDKALTPVFSDIEAALTKQLKGHSLADVIQNLYDQAGQSKHS
ncbi:Rrf2 family transcriptional regulator [Streptococcus cameli]